MGRYWKEKGRRKFYRDGWATQTTGTYYRDKWETRMCWWEHYAGGNEHLFWSFQVVSFLFMVKTFFLRSDASIDVFKVHRLFLIWFYAFVVRVRNFYLSLFSFYFVFICRLWSVCVFYFYVIHRNGSLKAFDIYLFYFRCFLLLFCFSFRFFA